MERAIAGYRRIAAVIIAGLPALDALLGGGAGEFVADVLGQGEATLLAVSGLLSAVLAAWSKMRPDEYVK